MGFSVVGINVQRAATSGPTELFEQSGAWHIRVHNENARTGLIQFANGSGVALPVLPGFVGTVLVQDNEVVSIAYAPAIGTQRYYAYDSIEVDKRRAFASVAMGRGYFRVDAANARRFATYVRELKSFDPILGLFAAYAYSQAGLQEHVDDIYSYMAQEDIPILFDVAMLADRREKPIAPFCPLLRQSWAAYAGHSFPKPPFLESVAAHLRQGLWTTFNHEGMELLFEALQEVVFE